MTNQAVIWAIVDALYQGCMSAGGDGDAYWYTRYYSLEDILPIVHEYNSKLPCPMKVKAIADEINWGQGEEWIVISTDEEYYKNMPSWYDIVIKT